MIDWLAVWAAIGTAYMLKNKLPLWAYGLVKGESGRLRHDTPSGRPEGFRQKLLDCMFCCGVLSGGAWYLLLWGEDPATFSSWQWWFPEACSFGVGVRGTLVVLVFAAAHGFVAGVLGRSLEVAVNALRGINEWLTDDSDRGAESS